MLTLMSKQSLEEHWGQIYQDLWTTTSNNSIDFCQSVTGANVLICCPVGKMAFHREKLQTFTNILDILGSQDKLMKSRDPWGTLTLVIPHFSMEALKALSQLIYTGYSGNMTNDTMQVWSLTQ